MNFPVFCGHRLNLFTTFKRLCKKSSSLLPDCTGSLSPKRHTQHNNMAVPKFISRCCLVVINIVVFALAGLLLYFGIKGAKTFNFDENNASGRSSHQPTTTTFTNATNHTDTHTTNGGEGPAGYVLNPFRSVIFIAGFMMVTSFLGLYAAFSFQGTKRTRCLCTLFLHLLFNFVGVACLVYGAAFVLIFADDADEMIIIFWTFTKGALPSSMTQSEAVTWFHQHLNGAASVLIVCAILLIICIGCDSHLLGHDLTARRIVITTNVGTMLLGLGFIVVAAMNKYHNSIVHKDVYLPYVAGGVGVCTFVISLIGIVAVCGKRRPRLLCFYSFLMLTLTSSLVIVAIISFQRKNEIKQWVKKCSPFFGRYYFSFLTDL